MVEGLQEGGDVEADDARHEGGDGEDDGGQVDGEAGVGEERVEHDADTLAAVDDAEGVEGHDEEEGRRAGQAGAEDGDGGEGETGEQLEGDFQDGVLQEEGLDRVGPVVVFAVEDLGGGRSVGEM